MTIFVAIDFVVDVVVFGVVVFVVIVVVFFVCSGSFRKGMAHIQGGFFDCPPRKVWNWFRFTQ